LIASRLELPGQHRGCHLQRSPNGEPVDAAQVTEHAVFEAIARRERYKTDRESISAVDAQVF